MVLSIEGEDGACQCVDGNGQAVGIVLMALKEREESGVQLEGQFSREGHSHKDEIETPDGVILSRFVCKYEEKRKKKKRNQIPQEIEI